jgi:hypothetical protein
MFHRVRAPFSWFGAGRYFFGGLICKPSYRINSHVWLAKVFNTRRAGVAAPGWASIGLKLSLAKKS